MDLRLEKLAMETILAATDAASGPSRKAMPKPAPPPETTPKPQERPAERLGATSAGSGCGWHRSALAGPFWGFWRRF
jgi:hypothetical protein